MRIGIFGGSFNPIHNGHIALGETMLGAMRLDEVWYMVSPHNPLKQAEGLLDEEERLRMVRLALEGHRGLRASDYEFSLPRPSYTWNTLQCLHRDYPDDDFVLIIGGDNWAAFHRWAHYEDILATHEVAVFPRQGAGAGERGAAKGRPAVHPCIPESLTNNVTIVDVPLVNVTSTMLREMVAKGEDIAPYVPESVAHEVTRASFYS